jgi:hypothetical protein
MKLILAFVIMLPFALIGQSINPFVKFDKETMHLGKIKKGDLVKGEYTFVNVSKEKVQIDIVSTCECTEAKWTTYAVNPGEKGSIKFIFDSSKKEIAEPVDIDVYFTNVNPKTGHPTSVFLNYTFEFL